MTIMKEQTAKHCEEKASCSNVFLIFSHYYHQKNMCMFFFLAVQILPLPCFCLMFRNRVTRTVEATIHSWRFPLSSLDPNHFGGGCDSLESIRSSFSIYFDSIWVSNANIYITYLRCESKDLLVTQMC